MDPNPARTTSGATTHRRGFDLLDHLQQSFEVPRKETLFLTGPSGSGKTSLLRALVARLQGPKVFALYRQGPVGESAVLGPSGDAPTISLLVLEPGALTQGTTGEDVGDPARLGSLASAPASSPPALPSALVQAARRMEAEGGGSLLIDSWDEASEQEFRRQAGERAVVTSLLAPSSILRGGFEPGRARTIIAKIPEPDPEAASSADGLFSLGWEDTEGFRVRVLTIAKMRHTPPPETRYLYTLSGGDFACPAQFPPGFRAPIGPPPVDSEPEQGSLFPGSVDFAQAFGRLRYRALTGLEVPPRFPSHLADIFLVPLVVHTLSIGGRVVWTPSAQSGPLQITQMLSKWIPPEFLRERLRVVSAGGLDQALGELRSVALPVRGIPREQREGASSAPPGVSPVFPEAYHFLQQTPEGRPSLYVIYLDGLHALAAVAGTTLNPETLPLIVAGYSRLPRFHGLGFGRSDDPLTKGLVGSVETHIRVEERYGRTLLFGIRPRSGPYILDWSAADGRYSLIPVT